ncbi:hypothetical protein [Stenotrophomonas maltophilia]|uniref:hypothetical protein n=1 Tax=Stenotrophomonas maltophilia TaxID=40324 RepID=UPI000B422A3A|nr:hypothetical protein [Stenotrophomonas maltophilia]OWB46529.1 hypothetical protein B7H27_10355 [Stenotrophomonas maltophilia]
MSGRIVTLNASKGGINRLRTKGGADPNTLYDLVNGYVDQDGVPRSRPGTKNKNTLPTGATKGLCAYDGKLIVFSHEPQTIAASTPVVECEVLKHPNTPDLPIKEIHFAGPFLGYLYVVPEFVNGDVFHYWLQRGTTWEPGKIYLPGSLVTPTAPNGIAYQLDSGTEQFQVWVRNVARALGDKVVPSTDNGYYYTVTDTFGPAPRSGATEPSWPTSPGATVFEDSDVANPTPIAGEQSGNQLPPDVTDRYGSSGGNSPWRNMNNQEAQ